MDECFNCGETIKEGEEYFSFEIAREKQECGLVTKLYSYNLSIWCKKCFKELQQYIITGDLSDLITGELEKKED